MPTPNGFESNEARCCTSQTTEKHRPWYAFFYLKTKQLDFKEWLFVASTKDCFAAIAKVHVYCPNCRFQPDSNNPKYNDCRSSTATFGQLTVSEVHAPVKLVLSVCYHGRPSGAIDPLRALANHSRSE